MHLKYAMTSVIDCQICFLSRFTTHARTPAALSEVISCPGHMTLGVHKPGVPRPADGLCVILYYHKLCMIAEIKCYGKAAP